MMKLVWMVIGGALVRVLMDIHLGTKKMVCGILLEVKMIKTSELRPSNSLEYKFDQLNFLKTLLNILN